MAEMKKELFALKNNNEGGYAGSDNPEGIISEDTMMFTTRSDAQAFADEVNDTLGCGPSKPTFSPVLFSNAVALAA